jgi:hypothetical protein
MELTKADKQQLHDLIKRGVLRRCDELLTNGYLTIDDFKGCRPEIQEKVRQWSGMEDRQNSCLPT